METQRPSIGRIVTYRSRTGNYVVPAIVNCTVATLDPEGVRLGHVPPLDSEDHVHLTVFTPGRPGMRRDATNLSPTSAEDQGFARSENVAGCYQEWNVPHSFDDEPGTWDWPVRT